MTHTTGAVVGAARVGRPDRSRPTFDVEAIPGRRGRCSFISTVFGWVILPVARADEALPPRRPARSLPREVDVLIVGSGPTGLTLATQLAAFPDISVCIVEQKDGPLELGQADGIACRTMEMFHAFGFVENVLKEAYWVNETVFWKPDPEDRATSIAADGSRMSRTVCRSSLTSSSTRRGCTTSSSSACVIRRPLSRPITAGGSIELQIPAGDDAPVIARLERTDADHEGETETVSARYVVGCDGARSTVRRSIGCELRGDAANQAWGVMDVLAVTDFPDIRFKAIVHSANEGNLLVIPREGGYLVRLYVELDKLDENERAADRNITIEQLIAAAQRILAPYTLEVEGGGLVVGLRDRPAPDRQVRRRTERADAPAARVHRRGRLPHPQPQGGPGNERVDARRLQPGLEAGLGVAGSVPP